MVTILFLSAEYKRMIDSGEIESQAALTHRLGLSRAIVKQTLNVLKIDPEIIISLAHFNLRYGLTERKVQLLNNNVQ
ncbi:hypothetical protein ACFL6I_02350 [candidate division KSB1 bacterium]